MGDFFYIQSGTLLVIQRQSSSISERGDALKIQEIDQKNGADQSDSGLDIRGLGKREFKVVHVGDFIHADTPPEFGHLANEHSIRRENLSEFVERLSETLRKLSDVTYFKLGARKRGGRGTRSSNPKQVALSLVLNKKTGTTESPFLFHSSNQRSRR